MTTHLYKLRFFAETTLEKKTLLTLEKFFAGQSEFQFRDLIVSINDFQKPI